MFAKAYKAIFEVIFMEFDTDVRRRLSKLADRRNIEGFYDVFTNLQCKCLGREVEQEHYDFIVDVAEELRRDGRHSDIDNLYKNVETSELLSEIERIYHGL